MVLGDVVMLKKICFILLLMLFMSIDGNLMAFAQRSAGIVLESQQSGKFDFIDFAIKVFVITFFILLIPLFCWVAGIDVMSFRRHKQPNEKGYQTMNMIINALVAFKAQYENWFGGGAYEQIEFLDYIEETLQQKNVLKFFPSKTYKATLDILKYVKQFNTEHPESLREPKIRDRILKEIEKIEVEYALLDKKYIKEFS